MTVLRDHFPVDNYVEFAVRPRGQLEAGDVFISPAQCFSCHPGSTQGVSSILAVYDFQLHFVYCSHVALLFWIHICGFKLVRMLWCGADVVNLVSRNNERAVPESGLISGALHRTAKKASMAVQ